MTSRVPVLLLGGSANALSAARALGARGVPVDAFGDGLGGNPVRRSRYLRDWREPATGASVQATWLDWLSGQASSVVIPCCDDGVELLATHRAELVAMGHHPAPGRDDLLLDMLDKIRTSWHAERAGVPTPRVLAVEDLETLIDATRDIGYPCGLKPVQAHRFTRAGIGLKGVTIADESAARRHGAAFLAAGHDVLVTEIVPGAGPGYCSYNTYIDDDGTHLFELTKEKLRQYPIDFGLGTFHRTVRLPAALEAGRRFTRATGLVGFANVEFRQSPRDGELKLIECNVRLTAANDLLTRAGCDAATIIYRRALSEPVAPVTGFREGLTMWHPFRDLRAMRSYHRAGLLAWREALADLVPVPTPPFFSVEDPAPSAAMAGRAVRRVLSRRDPAGRTR